MSTVLFVAGLMSLIAALIASAILAPLVFILAKKQGFTPLPRTLGTCVPYAGVAVAIIFLWVTLTSALERLNALERGKTFA